MKKLIALAMVVVMLFTALGVLAEEGQMAPLYATVGEALEDSAEGRVVAGSIPGAPLYATVGEALEDSAEGRVVAGSIPGEYYAVV